MKINVFFPVFKPDELRQALMPTLEKLYCQDPESLPFRQPVDPQVLGIPDYFDIVKKPMDLSTIKRKLDIGQYNDPWEYVDDVWLMFDNAWLYNRKPSRVYRYCTKVGSHFIPIKTSRNIFQIFPVVRSLRTRNRSSDASPWILLWKKIHLQPSSALLLRKTTLHHT